MKKLLLVLCFSVFLALQPVSVLANSPAIGWDPIENDAVIVAGEVVVPTLVEKTDADTMVNECGVLPENTVASSITAFNLDAESGSNITVSVKSILPNVSVICSNGTDYAIAQATFKPNVTRTASNEKKGIVEFTIPVQKEGTAKYTKFVVVSTKKVIDPTPVPTEKPVPTVKPVPTSNPVGETPTSPNTSAFPIETAIASFATLSLAGGLVLRKKRNS